MGLLYQLGIAAFIVAAASAYSASTAYKYATNKCNAAALQAEIRNLKRDIEISQKAEADANEKLKALETQNVESEGKVRDAEERLAKLPTTAVCMLDDTDVGELCGLDPCRAADGKPAASAKLLQRGTITVSPKGKR